MELIFDKPDNLLLDKTLNDNYLCLVASNKQQICVGKSKTPTGKWSTTKRVRIRSNHSAPSLFCDRRMKIHQSKKSK